MQCDFPFHFSSSGNGLARLAIASPVSLALPILRPLLISPLSEMGASRGARFPAFATLARPGLENGDKQKKKSSWWGSNPQSFDNRTENSVRNKTIDPRAGKTAPLVFFFGAFCAMLTVVTLHADDDPERALRLAAEDEQIASEAQALLLLQES